MNRVENIGVSKDLQIHYFNYAWEIQMLQNLRVKIKVVYWVICKCQQWNMNIITQKHDWFVFVSGDLKKMFAKIRDSKTEAERDKNLDPLQELITLVQFANDECDYGEGLELGLDLFTFGGKCFHSPIRCLLTLGYQLVGRPEFSKIIEAHLKRRSHSSDLSQLD